MSIQRHQRYQTEEALRIVADSTLDLVTAIEDLDTRVTNLTYLEGNDGLKEHQDYFRVNDYSGNAGIAFHCTINHEQRSVTVEEIITALGKLEQYENRIHELEERLAQVEFYSENAA